MTEKNVDQTIRPTAPKNHPCTQSMSVDSSATVLRRGAPRTCAVARDGGRTLGSNPTSHLCGAPDLSAGPAGRRGGRTANRPGCCGLGLRSRACSLRPAAPALVHARAQPRKRRESRTYLEGRGANEPLPSDLLFRWLIPYWKLWLVALVAIAFIATTILVGTPE